MGRIVGIPSDGPELTDQISEHFGHCNYFVGVEIDNNEIKKVFSKQNQGHSGCVEPVMDMKQRKVTDMIVGGIGATAVGIMFADFPLLVLLPLVILAGIIFGGFSFK